MGQGVSFICVVSADGEVVVVTGVGMVMRISYQLFDHTVY